MVHFPGSYAIETPSLEPHYEQYFDFLLGSGRAVIFPRYKGSLERGDDLTSDYPNTTEDYRDHVIAWAKDMGRSIDYLETRPEIDSNKLGYEGFSWGAAMRAIMTAVDERFKVNVFLLPGFYLQRSLPEVDQINFAPRVKIPTLMLSGRFDLNFSLKASQLPMFRFLGTAAEQKRHILYDTGHSLPRGEMIEETLSWLDRYLGRPQQESNTSHRGGSGTPRMVGSANSVSPRHLGGNTSTICSQATLGGRRRESRNGPERLNVSKAPYANVSKARTQRRMTDESKYEGPD